jgi:hypothetical protein
MEKGFHELRVPRLRPVLEPGAELALVFPLVRNRPPIDVVAEIAVQPLPFAAEITMPELHFAVDDGRAAVRSAQNHRELVVNERNAEVRPVKIRVRIVADARRAARAVVMLFLTLQICTGTGCPCHRWRRAEIGDVINRMPISSTRTMWCLAAETVAPILAGGAHCSNAQVAMSSGRL